MKRNMIHQGTRRAVMGLLRCSNYEQGHFTHSPKFNGKDLRLHGPKMQASPQVLKQHPGLANLIADLDTQLITPSGLSQELERELQNARYGLQYKQSLIETRTIFEPIDRLRFLPLDNRESLSNRAADLQRQVAIHIDRIISVLEARRLLIETNGRTSPRFNNSLMGSRSSRNLLDSGSGNNNKSNTNTSLSILEVLASRNPAQGLDYSQEQKDQNLDDFTLEQLRPHLNAMEGFSRPMTEAIQHSIQQRAQDVVTLFNNNRTECSMTSQQQQQSILIAAKSFADVLSHTKEQVLLLHRIKENVALQELAIHNQAIDLFNTLHQTIMVLWEILTEFMIRHQLEQDQTFKDYFAQTIDSLVLRLEILKVSLEQEVYDKDTNEKLAKVRDALEQRQQELDVQTKHNSALLQRYKSAGQEFNMIVDAYADIMQRIEVVQDDIRRLF